MRIAYLSVSDRLGGAEMVLLEIIKVLRRARPSWSLHLILPGRGPLLERAEVAGARCVVVPLPESIALLGESSAVRAGWSFGARLSIGLGLLRASLSLPFYEMRLRRALSEIKPDIVHSNGLKTHILASRNVKAAEIIWHFHDYIGQRTLSKKLLSRYVSRCKGIIAVSESIAEDLTRSISPSPAVKMIRNTVDLNQFHPKVPPADLDELASLAPPNPRIVRVGILATFALWKGHFTFLEAFSKLPADLQVRGYIIGGPIYKTAGSQHTRESLEQRITELGLGGKVGLTGFIDPAPALSALDIVVHASTEPEPAGLVIPQAMAAGRAVITSALGGAAEWVEPERDALTFEPGNPSSLALTIERLARSSSLRKELALNARRAAEGRFAPERLGEELVSLYEETASASATAR